MNERAGTQRAAQTPIGDPDDPDWDDDDSEEDEEEEEEDEEPMQLARPRRDDRAAGATPYAASFCSASSVRRAPS